MCTLRVCPSPRHGVVLFVSSYPRLRSLRSLSLGLLRSQPLRGCKSLLLLEGGDNPSHTLVSVRRMPLEDGDTPHRYIGDSRLSQLQV